MSNIWKLIAIWQKNLLTIDMNLLKTVISFSFADFHICAYSIFVEYQINSVQISWNSRQDLTDSHKFPIILENFEKIVFVLASHKPLELLTMSLMESFNKHLTCISNNRLV